MRKLLSLLAGGILAACVAPALHAQNIGLKTNLIGDALMSPNIGVEVGLAPKWTLQLNGEYNNWGVKDKGAELKHMWKHWMVSLEPRYWFCHRFSGHFISINAIAGHYNVGHIGFNTKWLNNDFRDLNTHRYDGSAYGAGFNYGYAWAVAKHWNVEAEIGVGWIWTRFDKYKMAPKGEREEQVNRGTGKHIHNYVGPTNLALSIEYVY